MPGDLRDNQTAFAVSPPDSHGARHIYFVIPAGAWRLMRDYRSNDFDLTKFGLPVHAMITRCKTRLEGIKFLERANLLGPGKANTRQRMSDKCLFGFEFPTERRKTLAAIMMVPEAAHRRMIEGQTVQRLDMRQAGYPYIFCLSAVTGGFAQAMARINQWVGAVPMIDATHVDVSIGDPAQDTSAQH